MKLFKRIKNFIVGILICAFCVWLLMPLENGKKEIDWEKIESLPDYDYIADIKNLMAEKKWGEAKILCEDIINAELPRQEEAKELFVICDKESKKLLRRIYKGAKAFVTGDPDYSIEEIGGSIASDLILYGDIRDLVKQGYFKITKQETDTVVIALAAFGIATEFIDIADWVPAGLKAIKKAGTMTKKMANSIIDMSKKTVKTRTLDNATKLFFKNTKKLFDKLGFIRTKNVFQALDDPADVAKILKHAENTPELTHLLVKNNPKDSLKILDEVATQPNSKKLLKKIVQKNIPKLKLSRLIKTTYKHQDHIKYLLLKYFGKYFYIAVLVIIAFGVFLIFKAIKPSSLKVKNGNQQGD